jgi:hypothetical protein
VASLDALEVTPAPDPDVSIARMLTLDDLNLA